MFSGDSFFTLSLLERAGLLALSLFLSIACILAVFFVSRRKLARIALALVLFVLFVWVSPQIYYFYYIAIFDEIPWQIVIKRLPAPGDLFRMIFFADLNTLSEISQGMLFWVMVAVGFAPRGGSA